MLPNRFLHSYTSFIENSSMSFLIKISKNDFFSIQNVAYYVLGIGGAV